MLGGHPRRVQHLLLVEARRRAMLPGGTLMIARGQVVLAARRLHGIGHWCANGCNKHARPDKERKSAYVHQRTYAPHAAAHSAAMLSPRCEAVRRAASVIDNLHALGAMLDASIDEVRDWLTGRTNPPVHIFLKAVDIIESHGKQATGTARTLAPR